MRVPRRLLSLLGLVVVLAMAGTGLAWLRSGGGAESPLVTVHMVEVLDLPRMGAAFVIQVRGGRTALIDTGTARATRTKLLPYLERAGIRRLDVLLITHAHVDHAGGLGVLARSALEVGRVSLNLPPRSLCLKEPLDCDYAALVDGVAALERRSVRVGPARVGQRFDLGRGVTLDVVHAPRRVGDVNGTSIVSRLRAGRQAVLFTGDLNEEEGAKVAGKFRPGQIQVMTAPHHGVEPEPPPGFFAAVVPKVVLVPLEGEFWCTHPRARFQREWVRRRGVDAWVGGLHGNVRVSLSASGVRVSADRPGTTCAGVGARPAGREDGAALRPEP